MLPFIKDNEEENLQQYILVYSGCKVLRCEYAEHKKGHPKQRKLFLSLYWGCMNKALLVMLCETNLMVVG